MDVCLHCRGQLGRHADFGQILWFRMMFEAWKNYHSAPQAGAHICFFEELPEDSTYCVEIDGFPILLVRMGSVIRAYVNACPHLHLPLDYRGNRLLSADHTTLRCTNHSAEFSVKTGEGVNGLGLGTCLDRVPIEIVGNTIVVGRD